MTDPATLAFPPPPIRVLIADDNAIARAGIKALLGTRPQLLVVGEAADGVAAVEKYRTLLPDLLLLDMRMPRLDGAAVAGAVLREFPRARVLVLSHYDGEDSLLMALRAGVHGYVTKEADGDELVRAISAVVSGQRYLPPAVAERVGKGMTLASLTLRERQVLQALFAGFTNRQIGAELGVTERTAGFHISGLLAKLGAKTRAEAVAVALSRGLIDAGSR